MPSMSEEEFYAMYKDPMDEMNELMYNINYEPKDYNTLPEALRDEWDDEVPF